MSVPPVHFAAPIRGTHLHGLAWGSGPPILFLHGFPDCAEAFVPLMEALSDTHHCIGLDQRGHGASDLAVEPGSCSLDRLADDIAATCDWLGLACVDLVGHDWGGLVAWRFAERYPHRTGRMVLFNAPHPWCLQTALSADPDQQARSAYVDVLRAPETAGLLEALGFEGQWARFCGHGNETFRDTHRAALRAAWGRPGAWPSMLRWYQDNPFRPGCPPPGGPPAPVMAPVRIIWGESDPLLAPSSLAGQDRVLRDWQVVRVPDGGHSVFREQPARAARLVRGHLDPLQQT